MVGRHFSCCSEWFLPISPAMVAAEAKYALFPERSMAMASTGSEPLSCITGRE